MADMTAEEQDEFFAGLSEKEMEILKYTWEFWARPNQMEPDEQYWRTWLLMAGRGFGKTRAGAEWVHKVVREGRYKRLHLVGATAADIRDIMVEGPSGILETSPPWFQARYYPTKRRIEWPNGAWALCFSADEPERLRGEQCEAAWADEVGAWRYEQAWTQLMLGLRLGRDPKVVVTTTPRPIKLIRDLLANPTTIVTTGTTWENVENLAGTFTDEITRVYSGSRIGRQELYAELLWEAEGALWKREWLDEGRVEKDEFEKMQLDRLVVGVDPAATFGEDAGETGIIIAGLGRNDKGYVIHDGSGKLKVEDWSKRVVGLYQTYLADRVIAEQNMGGDMVLGVLQAVDNNIAVKLVRASKGKATRAEPVAALYEQGRIHHVGYFPELEEQLCSWEPGMDSPDRLDALVWAFTELMVGPQVVKLAKLRGDADLTGASYWREFS